MPDIILENLPLGKAAEYISTYTPSLLCPFPRAIKRQEIGITDSLPFDGVDIWNAYELSWLGEETHKPRIAMAEFHFPCRSENLIESKSLKLYLNSLNQTPFKNELILKKTIQEDLSRVAGAPVRVMLYLPPFKPMYPAGEFSGNYIDDLPVNITHFLPEPEFLTTESEYAEESLYSNLLKSNCLVTGQPDWASIFIRYQGQKINHSGLLKYLISFREHNEFHEQCVERIFMDITQRCNPQKLTVYARYTRRGGLDINPFRSNFQSQPENARNFRQ